MNARRADSVFYNGRIITLDDSVRLARAVAVSEGMIVAVGDDSKIKASAPRGCDKFDLGGKTVVPGFIDSHTHFMQMGDDSLNVDLSKSGSLEDALSMMSSSASRMQEGDWVIGAGWMESHWPERRFIRRDDLDRSCPKNPAVAHRVCGHLSSVNSLAIRELRIDAGTPDVEVDSRRSLTGILRESAVGLVRSATAPDPKRKTRGLKAALRKANALGVTSIHDNGEAGDFAIFQRAEMAGKLGVRICFNAPAAHLDSIIELGLASGFGSEMLKLGGLKIFCDGALGARTAALSEPYVDDPGNKGMFMRAKDEFESLVHRAHEHDIQLVIHAIGDSGIDLTISSIAGALSQVRRRDHRHRIEHLELPSRSHLTKMKRLGIIASMQPNFVGEWGGIDGMYYSRLGPTRAVRNNPFREVLDSGVRMAFGSDCMPFSPLYGIHSAVNAPHESQRIGVQQALASYTRDAAYASFDEGFKGRIAEGLAADFVVLSADPQAIPASISDISVLKTVLAGEVVYESGTRKRA